ncbi:hypothetical protein CVD28_01485 [Bacillus sp. M6-12]|uniref:hypothetical protein n=1 Tax=Bacillus sp. M6-12 TaxID=2054166 RepID=UPI000C77DBD3|nr:hypothetical protein [Bacillus sp. M6-12]PLS19107.1 hypothetical protein CVD28_01485 [Bacillus sp. M6-12]
MKSPAKKKITEKKTKPSSNRKGSVTTVQKEKPKSIKPKDNAIRVATIKEPSKKKKVTSRSGKSTKKSTKKKKRHWNDTYYYPFYLSLIGYLMFSFELLLNWFLAEDVPQFLGIIFKNLIREPYVPTIIGAMFLLPVHTYVKGMRSAFPRITLIGFFFIARNIAHLTFLAML